MYVRSNYISQIVCAVLDIRYESCLKPKLEPNRCADAYHNSTPNVASSTLPFSSTKIKTSRPSVMVDEAGHTRIQVIRLRLM